MGKVPNIVPSVNKLNPNISQTIPIQTQTTDLNFAVLNVCGLKTRSKNYKLFKESIALEKYFLLLPPKQYITLMKFRTSNHRFPVETYRWVGIPLSERKCTLCDKDDIADELHYLLICPHFSAQRSIYIDTYYYRRPNILKFKELLSSTSCTQLKRLCKFVEIVINYFNNRPA